MAWFSTSSAWRIDSTSSLKDQGNPLWAKTRYSLIVSLASEQRTPPWRVENNDEDSLDAHPHVRRNLPGTQGAGGDKEPSGAPGGHAIHQLGEARSDRAGTAR